LRCFSRAWCAKQAYHKQYHGAEKTFQGKTFYC